VIKPEIANALVQKIERSTLTGSTLRGFAMSLLNELPGYDWCGIYALNGDVLELDQYIGDETDHTRIPVGVGVCGTAVALNQNQVIEDVRELNNYLACSSFTRSELVVLIRRGETILGQIDIDGHKIGSFDESDEAMLHKIGEFLAVRWE
jgi:L-methionine (R)-S-oxide reductase